MAFRKIKGSFKNADITTHVIEATYLAHDTETGSLRIGDGVTPGGTAVSTGGSTTFVGDDSATIEIESGGALYIRGGNGITTSTDSDGTLTITGSSQAQGITFVGDDSAGIEIAGNPAKLTGTVKISFKYIETGSLVFSPILKAELGVEGVNIASTFL